jgi:hypothetical protein
VVKVITVQNDAADIYDYDLLRSAVGEAEFLHLLQPVTLGGKPIVPRLLDAWLCEPWYYVVMDKWDGDMDSLSEKAWKSISATLPPLLSDAAGHLYRYDQFILMWRLVEILTKVGVIHFDLKADQFLYRNNGSEIVVTDMGMAGLPGSKYWSPNMGWSHSLGCPVDKSAAELLLATPEMKRYFNAWQLEAFFATQRVFVQHPTTQDSMLFAGVVIPNAVRAQFQQICPKAEAERAANAREQAELSAAFGYCHFVLNLNDLGLAVAPNPAGAP